jgi:hypothetical protein
LVALAVMELQHLFQVHQQLTQVVVAVELMQEVMLLVVELAAVEMAEEIQVAAMEQQILAAVVVVLAEVPPIQEVMAGQVEYQFVI